jgi:hypothetical protein
MRTWIRSVRQVFRAVWDRFRLAGADAAERGTATAEYAIATLAACGFAGILLAILRGPEVKSLLTGIIRRALSI